MMRRPGCDLSFSGLKTAVAQTVRALGTSSRRQRADIAASFQQAVVDVLADRAIRAMGMMRERFPTASLLVVAGGVASNTSDTCRSGRGSGCRRISFGRAAGPALFGQRRHGGLGGIRAAAAWLERQRRDAARPRWPLETWNRHRMNYRHAYHAGNFADCFKHALLIALLDALDAKAAPFSCSIRMRGPADMTWTRGSPAYGRGESGIRRLLRRPPPALGRYLRLVEQLGLYPGSPMLIRAVMRAGDRLACCELHPEDALILRRNFAATHRLRYHHRSGWEALGALLPPKEKRGLVFIDPPFEARDEFFVVNEGLRRGHARFGHGVFRCLVSG